MTRDFCLLWKVAGGTGCKKKDHQLGFGPVMFVKILESGLEACRIKVFEVEGRGLGWR